MWRTLEVPMDQSRKCRNDVCLRLFFNIPRVQYYYNIESIQLALIDYSEDIYTCHVLLYRLVYNGSSLGFWHVEKTHSP